MQQFIGAETGVLQNKPHYSRKTENKHKVLDRRWYLMLIVCRVNFIVLSKFGRYPF